MNLKLVRSVFNPSKTLGKLYVNDAFYAFTLEDTVRDLSGGCSAKVKNQTAISQGTYELILNYSNRFNTYMPLLIGVKCFEGIRIHGGNTEKDTEGCILIGAEGDMKERIWECADKVHTLIGMLKSVEQSNKTFIEIIELR